MTTGQVIVGTGLTLLGAGVVFYAVRLSRNQQDDLINSTNVLGTVARVDIDSRSDDGYLTYFPVLEYKYEYLAEEYTGDSIFPGTDHARFGHREKADAESVIEEYSVGDEIPVYVDSTEPSRAFVRTEETPGRIKQIGLVGGIFLLTGLFIVLSV